MAGLRAASKRSTSSLKQWGEMNKMMRQDASRFATGQKAARASAMVTVNDAPNMGMGGGMPAAWAVSRGWGM